MQLGHVYKATPRRIFDPRFWVVPQKKLGRHSPVIITWQALSLPDLINQSLSERGSNFYGMLPNSFLLRSARDLELLYIPQYPRPDQQAEPLPSALHSPLPVNPVISHLTHSDL